MRFLEVLRFGLRRAGLAIVGRAVTHPLLNWTWSGASETRYAARLTEFRPSDPDSVLEMMEGKYLLSGRMVDSGGVSPFAVETEDAIWYADLHGFGWLRHFSAQTDPGGRAFARTLVLDWIGRYGRFDADAWDVFITSRRILNWLKALSLLTEGALPDQSRAIFRSLSSQIQSIKVRAGLASDPMDRLMAAIGLLGAALCELEESPDLEQSVDGLETLLGEVIDADGLIKSRNPYAQIQILTEIVPVTQLLGQRHTQMAGRLSGRIEAMHRAFDALVMGTREAVFANGCGQLPVELVLAIGAQSGARMSASGLVGGYGVLLDGVGKIVADSGRTPPLELAHNAHAGALSFEFSCGSTLVCGNCGPAPASLAESRNLFRHSSAHSAPTIDDMSSARIGGGGLSGDGLLPRGPEPEIAYGREDNALEIRTGAYRDRYGLDIVRRLTLIGGGHTLVGQDRFEAAGKGRQQGEFSIRFHLAPGIAVERSDGEDLIRFRYRSGEAWSFLWEGARADVEDSVRNSAYFGLNRTRQIVLHGPAQAGTEIAWVFTRQS